jgi:hypothetical protein
MNQAALRYLRDLGGICGAPVRVDGRKRKCLRRPGHGEFCSPEWPRVITREDRLLRDVAKLKAQRDRRQRHREDLQRRVRMLMAQRERDRGYLGFRIQYRLIGARNRLRRYWRIVSHRTIGRALGTWPPS